MGHQPDISTLNAKAIEGLIEENHLNQALDVFKKWVDDSQSVYRKEVILLKSRYCEIKQNERLGILSSSKAFKRKNKLKWDILCLIEEITREIV